MPAPDNGTRRRIDVPGADWYWEQDDQLRLTYLSSRTSEKTALDLALDLSPYLGHKRCDQRALNLAPEDWDRHRGQLERREPFRDFELQVAADDGRTVWLSLSEIGRASCRERVGRWVQGVGPTDREIPDRR